MPKLVAPLTDVRIRNAKPRDKTYKLADGGGLYLEITPTGSKLWRMKFKRTNGKESRLSFGSYPLTSLAVAREKRDEAKALARTGLDLAVHRDEKKAAHAYRAANTFEAVACEWLDRQKAGWTSGHHAKTLARFEKDVFPYIGSREAALVSAPELLSVIRRIEKRGVLETAHRALSNCGQVFRYAVATGRAERDPSGDLRDSLPSVNSRREHFSAITEPREVGGFLRILDSYQGTPTVQAALKLAPLVFVRPGELRAAEWKHIDFETAEWRYMVTKTNTPHVVPLSTQAIAILKELQPLTGNGRYLFPSPRSKERPMSDNAILSALRRAGIEKHEMTGHGFRAMARTILDEVLGERVDLIEHQLAHSVRDANGRAYNRTSHLPERKRMMQRWADYLDGLKSGGNGLVKVTAN